MKLMQIQKFKNKIVKNILYIMGSLLLVAAPVSFSLAEQPQTAAIPAASTTTIAATNANATATPATADPAQYCPPVQALTKDGMNWIIGTTWKSYSESFVNKITAFAGAQWVGIKVGKIICLYISDNSFDFPIALEQLKSSSVLEPTGQYWSALSNNRKFCKSTSIYDCPFLIQQEAVTPADVYETIKYQPRPYKQYTNPLNN